MNLELELVYQPIKLIFRNLKGCKNFDVYQRSGHFHIVRHLWFHRIFCV